MSKTRKATRPACNCEMCKGLDLPQGKYIVRCFASGTLECVGHYNGTMVTVSGTFLEAEAALNRYVYNLLAKQGAEVAAPALPARKQSLAEEAEALCNQLETALDGWLLVFTPEAKATRHRLQRVFRRACRRADRRTSRKLAA
jgi:hypothetical protein